MGSGHYNIPLFIPHMACPHRCTFCNQKKISGTASPPSESEIHNIIQRHLSTIPENSRIEIAFFGGSFTGIRAEDQERYLRIASSYVKNGRVSGIRISTRPDYISSEILKLLKKYNVHIIELGLQSMDDEVLRLTERGHTSHDTISASRMIKDNGFCLGLQMMIGLPGDTIQKAVNTANAIVCLGAECVRIYPALVVRETELEKQFIKNDYVPLSLQEAVSWCVRIVPIFENAGIDIIRIGLHPSEGLLSGESLAAGPFHPSFRELVYTDIWKNIFLNNIHHSPECELIVNVSPDQYNYAVGYSSINKKMLNSKFRKVTFIKNSGIHGRNFHADYC